MSAENSMWYGFDFGRRFERYLNEDGGTSGMGEFRSALEAIRDGKLVLPSFNPFPPGEVDLGSVAIQRSDKMMAAQILSEHDSVLNSALDNDPG